MSTMSSSSSLHHWTRVIERELNQKQGHAEKLLAIHNRCCQPKRDDDQLSIVSSEVIVITGPTGVGKTTLALTFEDMAARHDNSFFCRGAFRPLTASSALPNNENLQQRQNADAINYEPFVAAMTELVDLLIRSRRRDSIQAFQTILLQDMDSSELELLEANIPVLRKITSTSNISRSSNATRTKKKWIGLKGIDAEKRNMRTFCKLIIAVCSLDHPLILLLEDLQAADQHSLDFIKMVLTNVKSGLTLIGTVRLDNVNDEEFGEGNNNILSTFLSDLKNSDSVTLTEIQLSPLLLNEVIEILSGLLHSSLEKVEPLATMVYHQTNGNMFDIVQLMKEFEGEGILYLDSQGTENWRWDEAQMVLSGWCNRPVQDLLTCRIKKLEEFDQRLLKSASCLGNVIHETLLSEIVFPSASVRPALERAKDDGLITFDTGMGSGRFLHHRIQDAFYSLIPQADRAKMHLDIGLRLWIWLPPNEMETHLFTVVSQILRGLHLLDDPVEKEDLAKLMLRAGQKAVQQSTFSNAASYFEIGVSLLQRNHWKHQYDISLALYNAAVEAQYYNGNIQQMDLLLAGIFKHGKSLDDMLQAHFAQIYSLYSRGEARQAFDKGMEVLKLLGVTFPSTPGKFRGACAWANCSWLLRGLSDDDIMILPVMENSRHLIVMRLLALTMTGANLAKPDFLPHLLTRMIHNTLKFGISDISCFTFAVLGLCMGRRGQTEMEARFSHLANQLLEKFEAQEWRCRVTLLIHNGGKHKLNDQIKPLQSAHQAGLAAGDVEASMVCGSRLCRVCFFASQPLPRVFKMLADYRDLCSLYNQQSVGVMLSHQQQVCLNFMGKSANPLVLTGEVMNEEETIEALQGQHLISLAWLLIMKHMLAVYFNDLQQAVVLSEVISKMRTSTIMAVALRIHLFLEGLTAATLSRHDRQQALRARQILVKLKSGQQGSSENFENKICLVEAEMTANRDEAISKYQQSIKAAQREGFLHEHALAHETLGQRLMEWGDQAKAREHFVSSQSLYNEWGAQAKVDDLQALLSP